MLQMESFRESLDNTAAQIRLVLVSYYSVPVSH